jgi:hypothetical protein
MKLAKRFATVLLAVLREIFDEAAYDRFLQRNQLPSSAASYAAFLSEHQAQKARRPRCC